MNVSIFTLLFTNTYSFIAEEDNTMYPHVAKDQNTAGDEGMSDEDSEMDLIARDIRHFDNYSNITAKSHQR